MRSRIGVPGEQTVATEAKPLFGNQQFTSPRLVPVKPVDEEYLGTLFVLKILILTIIVDNSLFSTSL